MGVFDLFSKRQRLARGEVPEVYVYDKIPPQLRVQIVHIIQDAFGKDGYRGESAANLYKTVNNILCREYGVFELVQYSDFDAHSLINFFLKEDAVENALDVVELCFKFINTYIRNDYAYQQNTVRKIKPDAAIAELNQRFKEHGVGYQFESNEIMRVDSEFIHSEAVKPTLMILRGAGFEGANEEFLAAHEHYRHGRHKECLVDCLKAFESTMKVICKARGWTIQTGATAKGLIATCFEKGLLPSYLESQFSSIRTLLESGVPTLRNKNGGNGQGIEPIATPAYLARFALNLTASSILFLVEANTASQ